jgi:hypothetical protein
MNPDLTALALRALVVGVFMGAGLGMGWTIYKYVRELSREILKWRRGR